MLFALAGAVPQSLPPQMSLASLPPRVSLKHSLPFSRTRDREAIAGSLLLYPAASSQPLVASLTVPVQHGCPCSSLGLDRVTAMAQIRPPGSCSRS